MDQITGAFIFFAGSGLTFIGFWLLNRQQNEAQALLNGQTYSAQARNEKIRADQYVREKEAETLFQKEINKGIALQRDCALIQDGRSPAEV